MVGKVVGFNYESDSRGEAYRLLRVENADGESFFGFDLQAKGPRRYIKGKIKGSTEVIAEDGEDVIPIDDFLQAPNGVAIQGDTAVRLYRELHPTHASVKYHEKGRCLVVLKKYQPKIAFAVKNQNAAVTITGVNGLSYTLYASVKVLSEDDVQAILDLLRPPAPEDPTRTLIVKRLYQ